MLKEVYAIIFMDAQKEERMKCNNELKISNESNECNLVQTLKSQPKNHRQEEHFEKVSDTLSKMTFNSFTYIIVADGNTKSVLVFFLHKY